MLQIRQHARPVLHASAIGAAQLSRRFSLPVGSYKKGVRGSPHFFRREKRRVEKNCARRRSPSSLRGGQLGHRGSCARQPSSQLRNAASGCHSRRVRGFG
jgi:hypothetical protein